MTKILIIAILSYPVPVLKKRYLFLEIWLSYELDYIYFYQKKVEITLVDLRPNWLL